MQGGMEGRKEEGKEKARSSRGLVSFLPPLRFLAMSQVL